MRTANLIRTLIYLFVLLGFNVFFSACQDDDEAPEKTFETGTVTDIEGNIYQTVKIGDQWWMAEDLKTSTFRSGALVDRVDNDEQWANTTDPAYTIYNDSPLAPGYLYNYHTVTSTENIAPEGWRVPTDEDWKELESFVGMPASQLDEINWRGTNEGDMLKVEATEGWLFFDGVWATNDFGFAAFGGSSRFYEGPFGVPGLKGSGFWWTADNNQGYGWYRYLDYKKSGVFRYYGHPNYGFSIRCIKE